MSSEIPDWAKMRISPYVLSIPEYVPGKPIAEVERELGISGAIKLASNENPLGPSSRAMEAIIRNVGAAHIYPESSGPELRQSLAERYGVSPDCVVLGNGSDEIMQMLAHVFVGTDDEVIFPENSFSMYRIVTRLFGGRCVMVPLKNLGPDLKVMAAAITPRTRLLFVSNPHSPTGTIVGRSEFEDLLDATQNNGVLLILDEAYREYVEMSDCPSGIDYLEKTDHLIFLRTFSKIYGLAGLRIGYGVAKPWLIRLVNRVRPPFNVNLLAQASAIAALNDQDHVRKSREVNSRGKIFLYENLNAMGFDAIASEANFIAFRPTCDAGELYSELLKEGIIVRHLKSFGLPDYIRVTVGLDDQNTKFIEALKRVS